MAFKVKNKGEIPVKFTDWNMGHPIRYVLTPGESLTVAFKPSVRYMKNNLVVTEIVGRSGNINSKVKEEKVEEKIAITKVKDREDTKE